MNEKTADITIAFDVFAYLDSLQTWSKITRLTEPTLEEIINVVEEDFPDELKGKTFNEKFQQLKEIVAANPELKDYKLVSQSAQAGYETDHLYANAFISPDGKTLYVSYRGTGDGKWVDNGDAFAEESSFMQRAALRYFNQIAERYLDANIIVSGHSKGGNSAQYVTLKSEYSDRIEACYSFDGQGFSPEFVKSIGLLDENGNINKNSEAYKKLSKIYGINNKNDYVSPLFELILEENRYFIKGGLFENYHFLETLLKNGKLNFIKDKSGNIVKGERGSLGKLISDLSAQIYNFPQEERRDAVLSIMGIFELIRGGDAGNSLIGTGDLEQATLGQLSGFLKDTLPALIKALVTENLDDKNLSKIEKLLLANLAGTATENLTESIVFILRLYARTKGYGDEISLDKLYVMFLKDFVKAAINILTMTPADAMNSILNLVKNLAQMAWEAIVQPEIDKIVSSVKEFAVEFIKSIISIIRVINFINNITAKIIEVIGEFIINLIKSEENLDTYTAEKIGEIGIVTVTTITESASKSVGDIIIDLIKATALTSVGFIAPNFSSLCAMTGVVTSGTDQLINTSTSTVGQIAQSVGESSGSISDDFVEKSFAPVKKISADLVQNVFDFVAAIGKNNIIGNCIKQVSLITTVGVIIAANMEPLAESEAKKTFEAITQAAQSVSSAKFGVYSLVVQRASALVSKFKENFVTVNKAVAQNPKNNFDTELMFLTNFDISFKKFAQSLSSMPLKFAKKGLKSSENFMKTFDNSSKVAFETTDFSSFISAVNDFLNRLSDVTDVVKEARGDATQAKRSHSSNPRVNSAADSALNQCSNLLSKTSKLSSELKAIVDGVERCKKEYEQLERSLAM